MGKKIHVEFIDLVDDIPVARIHWWNVSPKINDVEYTVFRK